MNRYVAFKFETARHAAEARLALRDLESRNELSLYDALVLAKDDGGQVTRHRDRRGVPIIGGMVGALMGMLLVFAFSIAGVLMGAVLGALLATLLFDRRIEEEYIADVEKDLQPGTSALLCLINSGDIEAVGYSLRPFHLRVYQSTLPPRIHGTLRRSLGY